MPSKEKTIIREVIEGHPNEERVMGGDEVLVPETRKTVREAAAFYSVSMLTIYHWCRRGLLAYDRVGGHTIRIWYPYQLTEEGAWLAPVKSKLAVATARLRGELPPSQRQTRRMKRMRKKRVRR